MSTTGNRKAKDLVEDNDDSEVKASEKEFDDEDDAGKKKLAAVSKGKNVSIRKVFSMADKLDVLLMVFGTLGACVRGSSSFTNMLLFGKIFESFGQSTGDLRSDLNVSDFPDKLLKIVFIYLGVSAVFFVGGFIELSCWVYTGERQATKLRRKYLEAILKQEVGYFETDGNTAEISNSLTESIAEIQTGLGEKMGHCIGYIWAAISTQVVGALLCWQIALLSLAILPLVSFAGRIFRTMLFTTANSSRAESSKADGVVEETVSQIRTVYSYVGETRAQTSFAKSLKNCVKLGAKAGLSKGIGFGSMNGIINVSWALVFYVAGGLISRGLVMPGRAIVAMFSVVYGSLIFSYAAPGMEAFANARRLAYPLHKILERQPAVRNSEDAKSLNPDAVEGRLELRNVHFVYPSRAEATVLSDFSVIIPAGKSLALVGGSGSGKSTIISLLARFYDPIKGEVLLDGEDLKKVSLQSLRSCIGLVGQEPALFATSIMENILLARPGATTQECMEAARAANAHSFIILLPDGYNTQVGDRGAQLSGGQKQRIAIARAVLKNPSILLLDEATSALDAESERIVQIALDSLMLARTCVVVAHRLSTIRNVDTIMVMSGGKIVEQGSPSELLAKGERGQFHDLKCTQEMKENSSLGMEKSKRRITSPWSSPITDSPQSEHSFPRMRYSLSVGSSPGWMLESPSAEIAHFEIMSPGMIAKGTPGRYSTHSLPAFEAGDVNNGTDCTMTTLSAFGVLKLVLALSKPEWKRVVFGWVGAICSGAVRPAVALLVIKASLVLFTGEPMDKILMHLHTYCIVFIIVALYATITSIVEQSQLVLAGQIVTKRTRERLFAEQNRILDLLELAWPAGVDRTAILRNEVGWYDRPENRSAMVTGRLAALGASINTAVSSLTSAFINNFSTVLFAIGLGLYLEWRMTLINATLIPLFVLAGSLRFRISQGFAHVTREQNEEVTQLATEAVSNIRTVYSFTIEKQVSDRLSSLSDEVLKKAMKRAFKAGLGNGAVAFIPIISSTICVYYIQAGLRNHSINFASAFTVFQLISNTAVNLSELALLLPTLPTLVSSANSINNIFNRKTKIDPDKHSNAEAENLRGFIELKEVWFSYPCRPKVQVLNNVSLLIKAGETVALVGESGSGKSSIIALLERFYDPTGGQILLDNVDIKTINLKWLRKRVGFVQQEPTLFELTIRENILYGKEEASEAEMIEAAKAANAHSFISGLPQGYNTLVGDRGTQLSGGQKQRVAIARAILKTPSILLLDEATSALDTESEKIVQEALDKLLATGSRTTVVVAHRLSTIQDADTIFVMSKGRIKERGNHHTLLLKEGLYARLLATHNKEH